MFGTPRPMYLNMQWNSYRPHNPHWGHPEGTRVPFRGQYQRFRQHRPPFQPGNDNYWCETCDRGFATMDILSKHKQQHQKCNIDGCQFVAHPKVITKHIQMQHSSGLYKKIANLNKPEDIEKWREERRKKYPTKTNIDKKAAELKEKIDRGEKMGLDKNKNRFNHDSMGYNRNKSEYKRGNRTGQGVKRWNNTMHEHEPRSKFRRNNNTHNKKQPHKQDSKMLPILNENQKLKPFAGILHLEIESDNEVEEVNLNPQSIDLIDDDEVEVHKNIETKSVDIEEPSVCGALSSLMCDYGSTDEDDNNKVDSNTPIDVQQEYDEKPENRNSSKNISTETPNDQDIKISMSNVRKEVHESEIQNNNGNTDEYIPNNKRDINEMLTEANKEADITTIKKDIVPRSLNQDTVTVCSPSGSVDELVICEPELNNKINSVQDTVQSGHVDDYDSGPEEVKVLKNEDIMITNSQESSKPCNIVRKRNTITVKKQFRRPKPKLPSTLLHKLLHKEMQQERNIVLQCIRYVRKNNYFENME